MIFKLSDGTEVEYHVPTPADAAAAVTATSDDVTMFSSMIRLAVVNPNAILEHIGSLPDPGGPNHAAGHGDRTRGTPGAGEIVEKREIIDGPFGITNCRANLTQ
jgi:hypothetical protein